MRLPSLVLKSHTAQNSIDRDSEWPSVPGLAGRRAQTLSQRPHRTCTIVLKVCNKSKSVIRSSFQLKRSWRTVQRVRPQHLDMANLTLKSASAGVTMSDNNPAVKKEHAPALSDEKAWRKGKVERLTAARNRCVSMNVGGHSGPDPEDESEHCFNTMESNASADFENRVGNVWVDTMRMPTRVFMTP